MKVELTTRQKKIVNFLFLKNTEKSKNASNNSIILQPSSSTPIYNVNIHVPNGVTLPKAR